LQTVATPQTTVCNSATPPRAAPWRSTPRPSAFRAAVEHGYLVNLEDRKGKPARLVIGEPLPEETDILPTVAVLQGVDLGVATVGEGANTDRTGVRGDRCSVARVSGGYIAPPLPLPSGSDAERVARGGGWQGDLPGEATTPSPGELDGPGARHDQAPEGEVRLKRALDATLAAYEQHLRGCCVCEPGRGRWCEEGGRAREEYYDAWLAYHRLPSPSSLPRGTAF